MANHPDLPELWWPDPSETSPAGFAGTPPAFNDGILQRMQESVAAALNTLPQGLRAVGTQTSSVGSITSSAVDLVETTVDIPADRHIRVTGSWASLVSTVAGDRVVVRIVDPNEQRRHTAIVSTSGGSGTIIAYLTPSAGARTYKLQAFRDAGSGTVIVGASAITPIYIAVEDAGPA